uniref:RING-type domain-containing protein n=1 Tax=Quercus lobata TaxID=97700 RepID=A0A7N2MSJ7_QUELO
MMSTFHKQFNKLLLASLVWIHYVISIATLFKQVVLSSFLFHSFSKQYYEHDMPEFSEELSINLYKRKPGTREEVECAVCMCEIEEGEEIRQLTCDHLFHRVCLDRWLGYKRLTCPLCRGSLFPCTTIAESGVVLSSFLFHSFSKQYYEHDMPEISEELSINLYKRKPGTREEVECAVYLKNMRDSETSRATVYNQIRKRYGRRNESLKKVRVNRSEIREIETGLVSDCEVRQR